MLKLALVFPAKKSIQTATDIVVVGLDVHVISNSWSRSGLTLSPRSLGNAGGATQVHTTNLSKRDLRTKHPSTLEGLIVDGDTWLAGGTGGLYQSDDAGVTWRFEPLPTKEPIVSIARFKGSLYAAGTCGWLARRRTAVEGAEEPWHVIERPDAPPFERMGYGTALPYPRTAISRMKVIGDELYVLGQGLWRLSEDDAAASLALASDVQLIDIARTATGTLLVCGLDQALWRRSSSSNSDKWTRVVAVMPSEDKIAYVGLVPIDDQHLLLVANKGSHPLATSVDDGVSFEPIVSVDDLMIEDKPLVQYADDFPLRTAVADGQGGALVSGWHGLLLRVSPEGGLGPWANVKKGKMTSSSTKATGRAIKEELRNPSPLVKKAKNEDEEKALLGAVIASPDDDAPRLIYADWLTEHGDPRGEFIQLQCTLYRGDPKNPGSPHPEHVQMLNRVGALMKQHAKAWLEPIRQYFYAHDWSRGFLDSVKGNPKFFPGAEKVFASHPITRLTLEGMKKKGDLDAFGEMPMSPSVRWLCVAEQRIGPTQVHVLLDERMANIEWLFLWSNPLGDKGVKALATQSQLTKLRGLSLLRCDFGDDGLEALAASPMLSSIELLNLAGNRITSHGAKVLAESPHLKSARHIKIAYRESEEIDADVLKALHARLKPGYEGKSWEPY